MFRVFLALIALTFTSFPANAEQQATGQYVEANGVNIYYEVSGSGEPLILLHGAYMSIPLMGDLVPELSKHRKVYALEFQGHGRTADIDRPITYQNLADDVAAFMDALGISNADVVGYSMGGGTAIQLAIRHPKKAKRIASLSAVTNTSGWQPMFKQFIPQMSPEMLKGSPFETNYKQIAANPDNFDALAHKLIALDEEEFNWNADASKIKVPVLLIAGDADVTTLEHTVELFRQLGGGQMGDMGQPMPPVRLAILPASSHTAVVNQVPLVMSLIGPFLADEKPAGMFADK